jgi:MFS family permease
MKKLSEVSTFRAFRSMNYTLYFIGRSVSQFGTWMQRTAVIWLVYSITHSALLIGVTIFAEQIPSFLFSMFGGVAADRYNRYTVIKITQVASIIQSVLLALLVVTGHFVIWAILALSVILGVINAFDVPARQALVNDVVADPADLPNALSLTTAMASLAQLLGPALSGIVLSAWGAATCFFINAASFGGVIISLLLMTLPAYIPKKSNKKPLAEFADGLKYINETPAIGLIILFVALSSLLVLPYNTVLPVFAKVIFKGNAATFGYINSFIGAGAVAGTIFIASIKPGAQLKKILWISTIMLGVGLICFSQFKNFPLAMVFAAIAGFGGMALYTVCNITVQSETAQHMRGRVIGVLLMAIFGMMPVGSVIVGAVSQYIGAPITVLTQGFIAIVIAVCFTSFLLKRDKLPAIDDVAERETGERIVEDEA